MLAIETLLQTFRRISGLKAHHCAVNSDHSLEFDGFNPDGSRFHIKSMPVRGQLELEAKRLAILQRHGVLEALVQEINYGQTMTDGTDIRALIADAKAKKAGALANVKQAASSVTDAVLAVEDAAKKLEADAVDLRQSVADLTNGGP